jgi:ribosomal protein S18 acetylase RimI-like enzyme
MAQVHIASWQTTYGGKLPQDYINQFTLERRTAYWTAALQREGHQRGTFVACNERGEVVGFAGCGPIRQPVQTYDGELYVIYLLESAQRRGYGRALVHACAVHLTAIGLESMMLWVLRENEQALRFYAAMGGIDLGIERAEVLAGTMVYERAYGWPSLRKTLEALEG